MTAARHASRKLRRTRLESRVTLLVRGARVCEAVVLLLQEASHCSGSSSRRAFQLAIRLSYLLHSTQHRHERDIWTHNHSAASFSDPAEEGEGSESLVAEVARDGAPATNLKVCLIIYIYICFILKSFYFVLFCYLYVLIMLITLYNIYTSVVCPQAAVRLLVVGNALSSHRLESISSLLSSRSSSSSSKANPAQQASQPSALLNSRHQTPQRLRKRPSPRHSHSRPGSTASSKGSGGLNDESAGAGGVDLRGFSDLEIDGNPCWRSEMYYHFLIHWLQRRTQVSTRVAERRNKRLDGMFGPEKDRPGCHGQHGQEGCGDHVGCYLSEDVSDLDARVQVFKPSHFSLYSFLQVLSQQMAQNSAAASPPVQPTEVPRDAKQSDQKVKPDLKSSSSLSAHGPSPPGQTGAAKAGENSSLASVDSQSIELASPMLAPLLSPACPLRYETLTSRDHPPSSTSLPSSSLYSGIGEIRNENGGKMNSLKPIFPALKTLKQYEFDIPFGQVKNQLLKLTQEARGT